MNRILVSICMAVLMAVTAGTAFARGGGGQGGGMGAMAGGDRGFARGDASANAALYAVTDGVPFEYTGEVISLIPGRGLELATAEGNVLIYGIGPFWYWDSLGIEKPAVGDNLAAAGYIVSFNEEERAIAMSISMDDQVIALRDAETGIPLWRGQRPLPCDITEGVPFEVSGEIIAIGLGQGMEIATDSGTISVYGIGPQRYWEEMGMARPLAGDQVTVTGFTTECTGLPRNVAVAMEINGQAIQLRDPETGLPLWRRGHGGNGGPACDITAGTPFEFSGEVTAITIRVGLEIETIDGPVTVGGIGPSRFWIASGVERPTIGDLVTVTGYTVDCTGESKNIVVAITVNGQTVALRDPETGRPLWRRGPGGGGSTDMMPVIGE